MYPKPKSIYLSGTIATLNAAPFTLFSTVHEEEWKRLYDREASVFFCPFHEKRNAEYVVASSFFSTVHGQETGIYAIPQTLRPKP